MDFTALLKQSWKITWNNKFLWIFGLFVGGVSIGGGSNISWHENSSDFANIKFDKIGRYITDFLEKHTTLVLIIICVLFLIAIICFIMSIIAQGALIGSVADIHQDRKHRFSSAFKIGTKYFWRIFGLGILISICFFAIISIFFIPSIILFVAQSYIFAIILVALTILFAILIGIIVGLLVEMAQRYIVIKNQKILASISSACQLIKSNFKNMIFLILISWLISIVAGIALFIIFLLLIIILGLIGLVIYTLSIKTAIIVYIGLTILIIITLSLFVQAVIKTFYSAFWTLFWVKINK